MLMRRPMIEAARGICLSTAVAADLSRAQPPTKATRASRQAARARC
jgi:hypothetical protein